MASLVLAVTEDERLNALCKTSVGSLHPHTLSEALKVKLFSGKDICFVVKAYEIYDRYKMPGSIPTIGQSLTTYFCAIS